LRCEKPANGWCMIETPASPSLAGVIGAVPYRIALAGGWIDQPFVSRLNPAPPGSMVVACLEPDRLYMERCGMATGTRKVALALWGGRLPPAANPERQVRELYQAENQGRSEPSGSQDMVGLLYPGISRLDYDASYEGGVFPAHIETCRDPRVTGWLEQVLYLLPVIPRQPGYNPLGTRRLDPTWVQRLGETGKRCFDAILGMDLDGLGASFNACMQCWETLLPQTVRHPTIPIDLGTLLAVYQARYPGAMYSGCGGGYLLVASKQAVPGGFHVKIRLSHEEETRHE